MDVEIQFINNEKGKGLFAKKDYKKGDIIFEENPLVCCQFAWNEQYGYKACEFCMRPLETVEENARRLTNNNNLVIPHTEYCETNKNSVVECGDCGFQYCSEICRLSAFESYHRTLCFRSRERNLTHPLEKLVETWKYIHFPPETCNIMLVAKIIAMIQQAGDKESMKQKFLSFSHKTVNENADLVHKMVGEHYINHIKVLRECLIAALPCEGVEEWFSEEGFLSLLALIGTNGQGVGTSPISVWVNNVSKLKSEEIDLFIDKLYEDLEKESGTFLNNEGSALYSLQSSCNHSCVPNAEPNYLNNNFKLTMMALKDISAGEEILISYLDECVLERSRHSRQKFLAENYIFVCRCEKCLQQADDPEETSEEEMESD